MTRRLRTAVLAALIAAPAGAMAANDCDRPEPPVVPDGATATEDELATAGSDVRSFVAASQDYLVCLERVHACAHYITVNISSPNTPGLRDLQLGAHLDGLLAPLRERCTQLDDQAGRRVPLAVKIAPDMEEAAIGLVAEALVRNAIDAVIATNTTIARDAVMGLPHAEEPGGLSGRPVFAASNRVVAALRRYLPDMPIIGVGGITNGDEAVAKQEAGADLVQLYTGFVYRGPALVGECRRALR